MQPEIQIFFALLVAHIVGDFVLQSSRMVAAKTDLRMLAFARHILIHLLLSVAALAFFTTAQLSKTPTLLALALLALGHFALDIGKSVLVKMHPSLNGAAIYLADQVLHVTIIFLATLIAAQIAIPLDALWAWWLTMRDTILVTAAVVAATVFPAGYLIRFLLAPWSKQLTDSSDNSATSDGNIDGLVNAGLYLGWLERALLVAAFAAGSLTAVGLIVGAKSIARFPEFKTRAFAEYFLMGTLLSVAIAWIGGWILRVVLAS